MATWQCSSNSRRRVTRLCYDDDGCSIGARRLLVATCRYKSPGGAVGFTAKHAALRTVRIHTAP